MHPSVRTSLGSAEPGIRQVRSLRRRPLALSTWSTNKRNRERTVCGEDDSRSPPCPWPYARKFLIFCYIYSIVSVWKNKMLSPSGFLTSRTHDIVSVYSQ